uniref:Uncharacterized protein n=1 Tax=Anopheles quadriannulatus TaxID=34691 RepID=A0A182XS38_ANOQN
MSFLTDFMKNSPPQKLNKKNHNFHDLYMTHTTPYSCLYSVSPPFLCALISLFLYFNRVPNPAFRFVFLMWDQASMGENIGIWVY